MSGGLLSFLVGRIASAEQAVKDTKLKGLQRQARMALSMEDAQRLQQDIRKTETEQRRQRQDIFAVEDEVEARRDALIAALQKRLHRASRNQSLFVVRWSVVGRVDKTRKWRHVFSSYRCRVHVHLTISTLCLSTAPQRT